MTSLPIPFGQSLVLFTDLDGTLLDHHTYAPDDAMEALHLLAKRDVPLIFCSSKTFAEQVFLQKNLGINQPFILENGSAVAVPKGYFPASLLEKHQFIDQEGGYWLFSFAHADASIIRRELAAFPEIKGYADVSDAELASVTQLDGKALKRARERWFTETLLDCSEEERTRLGEKLAAAGFMLSQGGRFFTVQSMQSDKGKAVRWLADLFREYLNTPLLSAAVGDSLNDAPMLAAVDFPFLVQKPGGVWSDITLPGLYNVEGIGPKGFSAAVQMLLEE